MQLISYVKTATNKRYSYPRVAVIWIDVHPAGETQPTHHTHPTLSPCMVLDHTYLMRSTHSNLSRSHRQSWAGSLLPRKRTSHIIHSTMADRSVDGRLLGLLGSYHRHAIGTFNTCSRGSTHRPLTDTGGGYNLGGVSFPHTTPWPSQLTISTFHLMVPPSLQFNQNLPDKPKLNLRNLWPPCGLPTTRPSTITYIYT
jgi:hypothetical protein